MSVVFADSGYWIALLNPKDRLHQRAFEFSENHDIHQIVTSELVLIEVLNDFAKRGSKYRRLASDLVRRLEHHSRVLLIPHTPIAFQKALRRYEDRPDKAWSFTDCASFLIMEEHDLTDALAHDIHFEQAGFRALLRK